MLGKERHLENDLSTLEGRPPTLATAQKTVLPTLVSQSVRVLRLTKAPLNRGEDPSKVGWDRRVEEHVAGDGSQPNLLPPLSPSQCRATDSTVKGKGEEDERGGRAAPSENFAKDEKGEGGPFPHSIPPLFSSLCLPDDQSGGKETTTGA